MIEEWEGLDTKALLHRLGEISEDVLASTQNALFILVGIVRDQERTIAALKDRLDHLETVVQNEQESQV